jgi:hypothetical protein
MLPMNVDSPMGGTTNTQYQRATREMWIQETNISGAKVAFYGFWTQIAAIAGLNMRIGTGAFVTYTDAASVLCGSNAAMVRNDSAFTLARGRNELNFDVYRTDTADFGWNMSGFWLVNYTSDKHADGTGAHNHTVNFGISQNGTAASAALLAVSLTSFPIPETDYFINALGAENIVQPGSAGATAAGYVVQVERLVAEGGMTWETVYLDTPQSDGEVGTFPLYAQMRTLFKRFPGDADSTRMDIETSRTWRIIVNGSGANTAAWFGLSANVTYHSILYDVTGTLTNTDGGVVNIGLHRGDTNADRPGELVKKTTRTGDGSYAFTWYDNTENVYVVAEDGTNSGRTLDDAAV